VIRYNSPSCAQEGVQGKWEFVAAVYDGKQSKLEERYFWIATKTHITCEGESQQDAQAKAKQDAYKLNPRAKPKEIEAKQIRPKGDGDGEVLLGIYELKGDDLRICIASAGKGVPRSSRAKRDRGAISSPSDG